MSFDSIGIIGGAGKLGRVYAKLFAELGYKVRTSDWRTTLNRKMYEDTSVMPVYQGTRDENNNEVARNSSLLIYSVTVPNTPGEIGRSAKYARKGALITSFANVKTPESKALAESPTEAYKSGSHPLHSPSLGPKGQTMIVIPYSGSTKVRTSDPKFDEILEDYEKLCTGLGLNVYIMEDADVHDNMVADMQGVTHTHAVGLGRSWQLAGIDPSSHAMYANDFDKLQREMALRTFGQNASVYGSTIILNPKSRRHVKAFWNSVRTIYLINDKQSAMKELHEKLVNHFGQEEIDNGAKVMSKLLGKYNPENHTNSQLGSYASLLSWADLNIKPADIDIFHTPPYRIRYLIGMKVLSDGPEVHNGDAKRNSAIKELELYYEEAITEIHNMVSLNLYDGFIKYFNKIRKKYDRRTIDEATNGTNKIIRKLPELEEEVKPVHVS